MDLLEAIRSSATAYRLGWTLVHSLWIGTLLALLYAVAARLCRRSAPLQYAMACAALAATVGLSAVAFVFTPGPVQTERSAVLVVENGPTAAAVPTPQAVPASDPIPTPLPADASPAIEPAAAEAETVPPVPAAPELSQPTPSWRARLTDALEPALPWLTLTWAAGVVLLAGWQLVGWLQIGRLRRSATPVTDPALRATLADVAAALGIRRPVRLLESLRLHGPVVVGWLSPAILLPLGFATGLAPDQVRAVLAHELAHIRRYDYLVNLLVTLAETLLFYHPAAWYLARRLRAEREHCCDDLALSAGTEPTRYAEGLLALAQRQTLPRLGHAAVAARGREGSELRGRIIRLLGLTPPTARGRSMAVAAALLAIAIVAGVVVPGTASQAEEGDQSPVPPLPEGPLTLEGLIPHVEATHRHVHAAAQNLRVVASMDEQVWDPQTEQWRPTPSRVNTWAWYERLGEGRKRMDFDPQIGRWHDGARPYNETRWLMAYDGQQFRKVDFFHTGDGGYSGDVREQYRHDMPRYFGSYEGYTGLGLLPPDPDSDQRPNGFISGIWGLWDDARKQPDAMRAAGLRVGWTTHDGRRVVELAYGPRRGHFSRLLLDPQRGYLPVLDELGFAYGTIRTEVTEWKQLAPDLWYPVEIVHHRPGRDGEADTRVRITVHDVGFYDPAQADAIFALADVPLNQTLQPIPHGPLGAAELPDPRRMDDVPAEPLPDLPPLTEPRLWVPAQEGLAIDFDTASARHWPPDADLSPQGRQAWLEEQGIDAVWQPQGNGGTLILLAARPVLLDQDAWGSASTDLIRAHWGEMPLTSGPVAVVLGDPSNGPPAPAVLLFRTTGGRAGILRIEAQPEGPVQMQYRLTPPTDPPTTQPAPQPAADAGWRERFDEVYRLEIGQAVRRIEPPFIPERARFYREDDPVQARRLEREPDRFVFRWVNGKRGVWSRGWGRAATVREILSHVLEVPAGHVFGPDELMNRPLPGDWIVNGFSGEDERLAGLGEILSEEVGRPVRFVRGSEPMEVLVARGRFERRPLPGADGPSIHLLRGDPTAGQDGGGGGYGSVDELLRKVEMECLQQPVVNLAEYPSDVMVGWAFYASGRVHKLPAGPQRRAARAEFLETLSQQTGLEFSVETREVEVWRLEDAPPPKF